MDRSGWESRWRGHSAGAETGIRPAGPVRTLEGLNTGKGCGSPSRFCGYFLALPFGTHTRGLERERSKRQIVSAETG